MVYVKLGPFIILSEIPCVCVEKKYNAPKCVLGILFGGALKQLGA